MKKMNKCFLNGFRTRLLLSAIILLLMTAGQGFAAQDQKITQKLQGFDGYMKKILKDWNAPGVGVGIVADGKLVFSKGYGYRDYEKKLPITANTLFQIASNTKLFTAVAAGMLVNEGKLTWDKPVRDSVPAIRFFNNELNNTVTLRDMLGHRTGITRHDMIWYQTDFSRKELFERLKYLEPRDPLRQTFIYNNMMYIGAGYLIELQSGKTWEEFIRERIFNPLGMNSTSFSIAECSSSPTMECSSPKSGILQNSTRYPITKKLSVSPRLALSFPISTTFLIGSSP